MLAVLERKKLTLKSRKEGVFTQEVKIRFEERVPLANNSFYYMALSHEDWELQNSRIWLAKIDIDRGLDFPI